MTIAFLNGLYIPLAILAAGCGALGGVATFLFSLKSGHYKNNKYRAKLTLEILGSTLIAAFVGTLFPEKLVIIASFCIGLTWTGIIQVLRTKITKIVQALIGEEFR